MKSIFLIVAFLSITVTIYGQNKNQTDQVILKLKNGTLSSTKSSNKLNPIGISEVDNVTKKFHAIKTIKRPLGKKSNQFIYIIKFPKGTDIKNVIDEYYKTNKIEYAEPDGKGMGSGTQGVVPNDSYYYRQWSLKNNGSFSLSTSVAGADIDMENAWGIEQGDTNIIVGIIDSGCKLNHPEFSGRIWANHAEIPNNTIDDDANGYTDDINGWNFAYNNNNPTDDFGHGTNVAGIIGANGNNSIGYAGLDWNCKLMILKGLDSTDYGYYSWWAQALYYAADNGARVINMSLAGSSSSTTLQNAINYAYANNVAIVVCMGNENSSSPDYPAACANVIAVGATNSDDTRANPFFWSPTSGSNFGSYISVVAPGNYIYGLQYQSNTNYGTCWGGTSQATPHVTGLASLLLAQNPARTPAQIKSIIESTAEDQVGLTSEDVLGWDQYFGHGRINAFNALSSSIGIKTFKFQNQSLLVYPNPTTGSFKVIISDALPVTCKIVNEIGQLIYITKTDSKVIEITQKLIPGIYFLLIESGDKIESQKLIVQ